MKNLHIFDYFNFNVIHAISFMPRWRFPIGQCMQRNWPSLDVLCYGNCSIGFNGIAE